MTQETILWLLSSLCLIVSLELLYLGSKFRESLVQYDIDRMNEDLNTPVTEAPKGLTREEKRDLILRQATDSDVHEAAKVGNAAFEYWKEYGRFPKSKDDIEDRL